MHKGNNKHLSQAMQQLVDALGDTNFAIADMRGFHTQDGVGLQLMLEIAYEQLQLPAPVEAHKQVTQAIASPEDEQDYTIHYTPESVSDDRETSEKKKRTKRTSEPKQGVEIHGAMSGEQFMQHLRERTEREGPPIIFAGGLVDFQDADIQAVLDQAKENGDLAYDAIEQLGLQAFQTSQEAKPIVAEQPVPEVVLREKSRVQKPDLEAQVREALASHQQEVKEVNVQKVAGGPARVSSDTLSRIAAAMGQLGDEKEI